MSAARHVVNVARLQAHLPPCFPCIRPSRSFSTSASPSDLRRSASFLQRVDKILAEDIAHEDRETRSRKHRLQQADLRPRRKDKAPQSREDVLSDLQTSTPDRLWRHRRTLQSVQRAIQRAYGQEYTVEAFGSVRYGLTTENSDLDLVIMDPHAPHGWVPGHRNKMDNSRTSRRSPYNIRGLARVLQDEGFIVEQTIPWATVPIVKARDRWTGLHFDLNVNDRLGAYNSDLIREYCILNRIVRPFIASTKHWAKVHGLNEPSTANRQVSFSSYSLALMAIAFLQAKGYLPNLQSPLTDLPPAILDGHFWPSAQRVRCDVRFFAHFGKHLKRVVGRGEMGVLEEGLKAGGEALKAGGKALKARGEALKARGEALKAGGEALKAGEAYLETGRARGKPGPRVFRFADGRKVVAREDGTGLEYVPMPAWRKAAYADLVGLLSEWFKFWAEDFDPRYHMLSIRHGGLVSRKDCSPVRWQGMRKAPEQDVCGASEQETPEACKRDLPEGSEQAEEIPAAFGETPFVATSAMPSVTMEETPNASRQSTTATSEAPSATSEPSSATSEPSTTLNEEQRLDARLKVEEVTLASDHEVLQVPSHAVVTGVHAAESLPVEDGTDSLPVEDGAEVLSSMETNANLLSKPNANASECWTGSDGEGETQEASLDAVELSADALAAGTDSFDANMPLPGAGAAPSNHSETTVPSSEASADSVQTSADSLRTSADPEVTHSRCDSDAERPSSDLVASSLVNKQWQNDTLCLIDPFIRTKNCTAAITPAVFALFRQRAKVAYEQLRWGIPVQEVISGSATAYERLFPSRGDASSSSSHDSTPSSHDSTPSSHDSTSLPTVLSDVLRQYVYHPIYTRGETSTKGIRGAGEGVAGRGGSGGTDLAGEGIVGRKDPGVAGRTDAGVADRARARPTVWGSPSRVRIDGLGRSKAHRRVQGPQTSIHERLSFDSLGRQVWQKRITEDSELDLRVGVFGYMDEYEGEGMGSGPEERSALPPSSPEPAVAPAGAEERGEGHRDESHVAI